MKCLKEWIYKSVTARRCGLVMAVLLAMVAAQAGAQNSERIVILWDVTGSLLPQQSGTKDLDGSSIPTWGHGNGMWRPLKEAIIDCIEYAEEDPDNEIVIVTFHDVIRDEFSRRTTAEGKRELVDYVRNYKYQGHTYTNISNPIRKFCALLDANKVNYMFLFTDGAHDVPGTWNQFLQTLGAWSGCARGYSAYGFYVLVHPDADKPEIRQLVEAQENFWIVPDAKVRVKICSLPATLKYNVREEKGSKTVAFKGKYAGAMGKVRLTATDDYYDVVCQETSLSKGRLTIEVKPKSGVNPPPKHTIVLTPHLAGADDYTFIGPQQIELEVSNLPERSLNLAVEDNHFGKASYYGRFLFAGERCTPATAKARIEFSEQARVEHSSVRMQVYLVDKKSGERVSLQSQHLSVKVSIDGKEVEGQSVELKPGMDEVAVTVAGGEDTKSGTYYGRIELQPTRLDNCTVDGAQEVYKWKVRFSHQWNPLKVALFWILVILVVAFVVWMMVLKPIVYPRFGSVQKTFNVPGMAPLIVKFRGARMVVVAASHGKRQSAWNRFWTGKIVYKTHPAFARPIEFKPARKRSILAKCQQGTYRIQPNPMPGVGSASIDDTKTKLHIIIN